MLLKKINLKIMLFKQIRALGISQVGKPFKLDVSVTPEGMGWALWNLKNKKKGLSAHWLLLPTIKGGRSDTLQ